MTYDAAVIGGGLAGIVAARRIQECGARPVILEKAAVRGGLGNARISGGLIHLAWRAMDEDPELLYRHIMLETDGEADPDIARVLATCAGRCLQWIQDAGIEMQAKDPSIPYQRHALYPHRPGTGRRIRPEFGSDKLVSVLWDAFLDAGGDARLGWTAHTLEPLEGGGWAVLARNGDHSERVEADQVLVADGGFQANSEMLSRYVGPNAGQALLRAMTTSTGDGLSMLMALGAKAIGLGRVYGHVVSRDALENDELWPYPSLDKLALDGVLVDLRGDAFLHGATDGVALVTRLARTENPRGYAVVFDESLWQSAGRDNPYNTAAPNPDLVARGARIHSGESLVELAGAMGADATRLAGSVDRHNADGATFPVQTPPYYAVPIVPGITFTMGGVAIDSTTAVLDLAGLPIPGLYAAGSSVGGVHGGPRGGYVGGLAASLILGVIAGETMSTTQE